MDETAVIKVMNSLSQEIRLKIVRYLIGCADDGAPAGEIGKAVSAEGSKASFHLSNLESAGVVTSERRSRKIIYRIDRAKLGGAISFLLNDCCDGHPDILACCTGVDATSCTEEKNCGNTNCC